MVHSDVMLDRSGSTVRGLIQFRGSYYLIDDLAEEARVLQNKAMQAKLAGKHKEAVVLYRDLIPYLSTLDELGVFGTLSGLPVQIAKRTIEQLEEVA